MPSFPNLDISTGVLIASLVVHVQEFVDSDGHDFDLAAMRSLANSNPVKEWLSKIDPVLLPVKRSDDSSTDGERGNDG